MASGFTSVQRRRGNGRTSKTAATAPAKKRVFIFMCNNKTENGCLSNNKVALPSNQQKAVEEITLNDLCGLYNYDTKCTLFPLKPTSTMHWDNSRSNGFQGRYPVQLNIMCHPKAQWLHIGKPPSMPGWAKGKPYKEMLAYRAELFKASNKEQAALQRQHERQEEQRRLAAVAEAYTRAPAEARFAEQAAERRMSQFEAEEKRKISVEEEVGETKAQGGGSSEVTTSSTPTNDNGNDSDEERAVDLAVLCQMFPDAGSDEIESLLWTEDRKGVEDYLEETYRKVAVAASNSLEKEKKEEEEEEEEDDQDGANDSDEERTADLAALCKMFPDADSEEIETLLWTEDRKGVKEYLEETYRNIQPLPPTTGEYEEKDGTREPMGISELKTMFPTGKAVPFFAPDLTTAPVAASVAPAAPVPASASASASSLPPPGFVDRAALMLNESKLRACDARESKLRIELAVKDRQILHLQICLSSGLTPSQGQMKLQKVESIAQGRIVDLERAMELQTQEMNQLRKMYEQVVEENTALKNYNM